jgi:hemolysin-activating ACP:hemolysin acyltransferase
MYRWQIGTIEESEQCRDLFFASELGINATEDTIRKRIKIPLYLKQLITFYRNEVMCGFVTVAFLNDEAETHMATTGILASDWKSGENFWVVDFVAHPFSDGYKMLRMVTKDLGVQRAKYFRHKHCEIREVRASV